MTPTSLAKLLQAFFMSPVGSKPATCGRFKTSQLVILLGLVGFLLD